MNNNRIKLDTKTIIIVVAVLIIVPLVIFLLYMVFRGNPYGDEIVIDNFESVFTDVPGDTRYGVYAGLYDMVSDNVDDINQIPESGALIREGSGSSSYNETQNMHYGSFIVDIPSLKQSYSGYYKWSNDSNNPFFYGNYVGFDCVSKKDIIYEDFVCVSAFSDPLADEFPIIKDLPLTIEYYSNDYSQYTKYDLKYRVDEEKDKLIIIITDYEGGAYEKALAKIRELGYNPDDYEYQYNNVSSENDWEF